MPDELGTMDPIASPATVNNLDILDLGHRIDAFLLEIGSAASATRFESKAQDVVRLEAMLARFKSRFDLYSGDPELDLPKYHPKPLTFPAPPTLNRLENRDSQAMLNLWAAMRVEMAFSDSGERATGFKGADVIRINEMIDKMGKLVAIIKNDSSIDLPDVDRQEPPANPSTGAPR